MSRLVIESVVEDRSVKRRCLREVERVVSRDTIIGSSTSAIPPSVLQRGLDYPHRVLGMFGGLAAAIAFAQMPSRPPVAPLCPVTDDAFDAKIVDPYRYMQNLKDPEADLVAGLSGPLSAVPEFPTGRRQTKAIAKTISSVDLEMP